MYWPAAVMVPAAADPPAVPSTDQVTPPLLAVNCCVRVNVRAATRGDIEKPVPVPVRLEVCGFPTALSETDTAEMRAPVVVGVKVTLIVQTAPVASVDPQLLVWAKSPALPPEIPMELMASDAFPALVNVTGTALLVEPVGTLPKSMLFGLRITTGPELPPTGIPISD